MVAGGGGGAPPRWGSCQWGSSARAGSASPAGSRGRVGNPQLSAGIGHGPCQRPSPGRSGSPSPPVIHTERGPPVSHSDRAGSPSPSVTRTEQVPLSVTQLDWGPLVSHQARGLAPGLCLPPVSPRFQPGLEQGPPSPSVTQPEQGPPIGHRHGEGSPVSHPARVGTPLSVISGRAGSFCQPLCRSGVPVPVCHQSGAGSPSPSVTRPKWIPIPYKSPSCSGFPPVGLPSQSGVPPSVTHPEGWYLPRAFPCRDPVTPGACRVCAPWLGPR